MFKFSETISKTHYSTSFRPFGLFIVLILLTIVWWISDSVVFYQWSLVSILSLYTCFYYHSTSKLKQTVKKTRCNISFYRRNSLTFMDWCFWCFMVYHSLGFWDQSTVLSWLLGLFCACLLFSIVGRSCIPSRFKIRCGKEYILSKETDNSDEDWVLYKILEHQNDGLVYHGPVYVDKTGQDEFFALLQAKGITLVKHQVMEWSNAWSNLVNAMAYFALFYFVACVMPDIVEMMFPVGWSTTKSGSRFYRTESMQDTVVFFFMLILGIPLALMAMFRCVVAIVTAIQGGRASILFLPDKVILSHYDKNGRTHRILSVSNLRHFKRPHKGDKDTSPWDLDETVQLIDKDGELVELKNWSDGSERVINHLVQLGLPVLCFDYKKEMEEKLNKEREHNNTCST